MWGGAGGGSLEETGGLLETLLGLAAFLQFEGTINISSVCVYRFGIYHPIISSFFFLYHLIMCFVSDDIFCGRSNHHSSFFRLSL